MYIVFFPVCRELHLQHVRLLRERRELEARVKEWEERIHQAMRLKFGRVVDLDRLEGVSTNHSAEELRAKLKQQEAQQSRQLADLQVSLTASGTIAHANNECTNNS